MPPFVSIVICTKNRQDALETYALPSLQTLNYPNFEVVVVDDASSDGTQQFLRDYQPGAIRLRVVRNQRSRGLCHARNVGLSSCGGDIIAFIDDDCAVTPEWLNGLVSAYTEDKIAVVGGVSFKGDSDEIYINDRHAWGCNMSFRSSIFRRFRFDTGLKYSHYADETDLIGRIIDHGYQRIVTPKALARHYVRDASYRKQVPLSAYLNYHYLNAKKGSLKGYYFYVFSHSLKHVALVEYGLNFKGQQQSIPLVIFSAFRKSVYYLYVFLLEIPVAAKLKHRQEESLFRRNAPEARM
jgi:glycosyltransferase involved in cell wall biosynthesis